MNFSKFKPKKYRNVPTEYNGRIYDSKREASHAQRLDLLKQSGDIANWIPQVSLPLPGKVRVCPDFLIIHEIGEDGKFVGEFVDSKGHDKKTNKPLITQSSSNKYKQFLDIYGLLINIWSK